MLQVYLLFSMDLNLLLKIFNFLMNFYTIGRMFKKFTCESTEYCPDPTFIICYFGKRHTDDIKNFLMEELEFEETFNIDNTIYSQPPPIINIQGLAQPLFSDVNL